MNVFVFNLSIFDVSTSDFKLAKKAFFLTIFDVSTSVAFFKFAFVAQLDKSNSTFYLPLKISVLENIDAFILCLFYQSNC